MGSCRAILGFVHILEMGPQGRDGPQGRVVRPILTVGLHGDEGPSL